MADQENMVLIGSGGSYIDKICDDLTNSKLLADLSYDDAKILAQWIKAYEVPQDVEIITEGQKSPCLCILSSGKLAVYKETDGGKRKKIANILPGRSFGEMGVIDGMPHSASVIATEKSVILLITASNFQQLIADHPVLGSQLLYSIANMLSLRLRQTTGQLADFIDS